MFQNTSSMARLSPSIPVPVAASNAISMLVYRSKAARSYSETDLAQLLTKARKRNRSEHLTGLLIYDAGCFFQWIEGPHAGLARVWESIQRDPAHHHIELLRRHVMPKRLFARWDMRLARRPGAAASNSNGLSHSIVSSTQDWVEKLRSWPQSLPKTLWDEVFNCAIAPLDSGASSVGPQAERAPCPVWHPAQGAAAELARWSLTPQLLIAEEFAAGLVAQGATLESIYGEVFEPAARHIGMLWNDDRCSDMDMSLAMGRLQCTARTLGSQLGADAGAAHCGHSVLVAPQPGESHMLGAAMNSELYLRAGWNVSCEFPDNDRALDQLVRKNWFDVLDLSLSNAICRTHRLNEMRATIRNAHAASMNPAIAVIVDGRAFFEEPQNYLQVGADAGCGSVCDSLLTASRLMDAPPLRQ